MAVEGRCSRRSALVEDRACNFGGKEMQMKTLLKLVLAGVAIGVLTGFATTPGQLRREKLQQPREINGYPCAAGYAWFYADGKLESCTVSREIAVGVAQLRP